MHVDLGHDTMKRLEIVIPVHLLDCMIAMEQRQPRFQVLSQLGPPITRSVLPQDLKPLLNYRLSSSLSYGAASYGPGLVDRLLVKSVPKYSGLSVQQHHRLRDDVFLGGGSSLPESSRSMTLLASSSESAAFLLREGAALLVALDPEREGAKLSWDCDGAAAFLAGAFLVAGAFLAGGFFCGASDDADPDSSESSLNCECA